MHTCPNKSGKSARRLACINVSKLFLRCFSEEKSRTLPFSKYTGLGGQTDSLQLDSHSTGSVIGIGLKKEARDNKLNYKRSLFRSIFWSRRGEQKRRVK